MFGGLIHSADLRGALAEMWASLFFVFFGVATVDSAIKNAGTSAVVEPVTYALAFGLLITTLAFAIGDVSGGHINPAVTLSLAVSGNITPQRAFVYILAQFIGGFLGGLIVYGAVGRSNFHCGIRLQDDIDAGQGFLLEFMGTALLLFTVFNTALWVTKDKFSDNMTSSVVSAVAPLPIGFAVLVVHLGLGPLTGGGINPMRVLGACVMEHHDFWDTHTSKAFWIYFIGPFAASLVVPLIHFGMYKTTKPGRHSEILAAKAAAGDQDMTRINNSTVGIAPEDGPVPKSSKI